MTEVPWRSEDGITIVAPEGRVDALGAAHMATVLEARVAHEDRRIVVDMAEVRFIGSKGLQALLQALSACRSFGGDLKLARVCAQVRRTLEMIRFDDIFSVCESVDEAIAEFGGTAGRCPCAAVH
jgi:anti-anti-sigma factor